MFLGSTVTMMVSRGCGSVLPLEGKEGPAVVCLERRSWVRHGLALQWEIYSAPQAGSSEARSEKPKEGVIGQG